MFLTDRHVAERYAVHRMTVWRWVRCDATFPKPVRLSDQCSRWRLAELERWEAAKAAAE
jgi:predicted DNA-binding transcriptional regulator AlpA